ncbi:MAG: NfeD family protein [Planctomycetota bacterium]|nr:NfeD family protein [Planctomycetota bacterium]MDI6788584.1 NfeD family protein [Planctomycetota bacterium]
MRLVILSVVLFNIILLLNVRASVPDGTTPLMPAPLGVTPTDNTAIDRSERSTTSADTSASPRTLSGSTDTNKSLVYVVPIKDAIMDRGLAYFVRHSVERAKEEKAALIIFEINTPGGAVGGGEEYTIGICNAIDKASPITTVAYITHWAWSAGALISISADKIIMKQVASIGSAEVVGSSEQHQEKYTSAIRAEFKARAEKKGYPVNLVMAMVDKEMEVKEVIIDDEHLFLTTEEIIEQRNRGKVVEEVKTIISSGKLLNLTANDALKYKMASAIKEDRSEIPPLFGIQDYIFKETKPTWSEHLVMFLTSPLVSSILMLVGIITAGMALKSPGMGLPEGIAILCFALLFFGHYLVGLAEITEILIFALGISLLSIEIFLLPGFGVFGISGIIIIFISLILAMQDFTVPDIKDAPWQLTTLKRNFITVGLSFSLAVTILILFVRYLSAIPVFRSLILVVEEKSTSGFITRQSDFSNLLGKKGVVFTTLRPVGKITLLDSDNKETSQTLDVVTEGDFIERGDRVVIISTSDNRIVVEKDKS